MSKKIYRMTTALVATLTMAFPQFTIAQDGTAEGTLLLCLDGAEPPCPEGEPVDGTAVTAEDDADLSSDPAGETETTGEIDLDAEVDPVAPETEAETAIEPPDAVEAIEPPDAVEPDVDAEAATSAESPEAAGSDGSTDLVEPPEVTPQEPDDTATDTDASIDEANDETDPSVDADLGVEAAADAPVAAAAASTDAEPTDVTEDTVSADEARSSDEEYETQVDGEASEADEVTTEMTEVDEDEGDGLSRFEQALLLGLGAVAVGALLDDGGEVVANTGDRVVVDRDGQLFIYKDDDALLFREGTNVRTETFSDGSTRTFVARTDGGQIVTIRDAEGRVLRRALVSADGTEVELFNDTVLAEEVDVTRLGTYPRAESIAFSGANERALRAALQTETEIDRRFSLRQIREYREVRDLLPSIDLDTINFATGSAAIPVGEIEAMAWVGNAMEEMLRANPREVFLIEGHTDAIGDAATNLALSDRRAETVALALTEYFAIPPENLVVQGYGEQFLKVETEAEEQANRRATVRRITPLLQTANAD